MPSIDKELNYSKQQTYTNTCYVLFFVVLFLHSIVHISDSVIYWQIIRIMANIPYQRTILYDLVGLGGTGIREFGLLFFFGTITYILVAGMFVVSPYRYTILFATIVTIFSFVITTLDFVVAYDGVLVNIIIFILIIVHNKYLNLNMDR